MAVTLEDAQEYIENSSGDVASLLATAQALVENYIGTATIPETIRDHAVLVLTQDLSMYQRSPGGITNYAGEDTAIRLPADPMRAIKPMLKPFVGGGIA